MWLYCGSCRQRRRVNSVTHKRQVGVRDQGEEIFLKKDYSLVINEHALVHVLVPGPGPRVLVCVWPANCNKNNNAYGSECDLAKITLSQQSLPGQVAGSPARPGHAGWLCFAPSLNTHTRTPRDQPTSSMVEVLFCMFAENTFIPFTTLEDGWRVC